MGDEKYFSYINFKMLSFPVWENWVFFSSYAIGGCWEAGVQCCKWFVKVIAAFRVSSTGKFVKGREMRDNQWRLWLPVGSDLSGRSDRLSVRV